jgi:hypothetical protein
VVAAGLAVAVGVVVWGIVVAVGVLVASSPPQAMMKRVKPIRAKGTR